MKSGMKQREVSPRDNVTRLELVRPEQAPPSVRALWATLRGPSTATWLRVLAFALVLGGLLWRYDQAKTARALRREVLEQYLLYMNLAWEEYNVALPLALLSDGDDGLDYERYTRVLERIQQARRERRDAYARIQARLAALRPFPGERADELEKLLRESDLRAEEASGMLDDWVRDAYCMNADCVNTRGRNHDDTYPLFEELMKLRQVLMKNRGLDHAMVTLLESQFR